MEPIVPQINNIAEETISPYLHHFLDDIFLLSDRLLLSNKIALDIEGAILFESSNMSSKKWRKYGLIFLLEYY